MTCLTEVEQVPNYSSSHKTSFRDLNCMKTKCTEMESPPFTLKNESARQRWELFHRAIAFAKQTNEAALAEAEINSHESHSSAPKLTVVR